MIRLFFYVLIPFSILMLSCRGEALVFESPEPIHLTEDLTIEEGDSLIIEAGTKVMLDTGVNIIAYGDVIIRGTKENPVHIYPSDPEYGWGILRAKGECDNLIIQHAIIEGGLIMSYQTNNYFNEVTFKNQRKLEWNEALARFWYGVVHIENCRLEGNNRGEGFLLHNVQKPNIHHCFFDKVPDAIEYIDCRNGRISNNHFQDMADDAIDQNSCWNTLIENNRIFHVKDCGMELGSENFGSSDSLLVRNNLIVGCSKGIIVKESSFVMIEQSTFNNNGIGVEIHTDKDSSRISRVEIRSSVIAGDFNTIIKNDRSEAKLTQCLSNKNLPFGEMNLIAPVEFKNPSMANYEIISDEFPEGMTKETLGFQK